MLHLQKGQLRCYKDRVILTGRCRDEFTCLESGLDTGLS